MRQKLILDIADSIADNGEDGINVTNLSAKSKLSRPAISHHLKVLKDCGLVKPVKKGTQIFYQLTLDKSLGEAADLVQSILKVIAQIKGKTEEEGE